MHHSQDLNQDGLCPLSEVVKGVNQRLIKSFSLANIIKDLDDVDVDSLHAFVSVILQEPEMISMAQVSIPQLMRFLAEYAYENSQAAFLLYRIYKKGIPKIVTKNQEKARSWLDKALKISKLECQCILKSENRHLNQCSVNYVQFKLDKYLNQK